MKKLLGQYSGASHEMSCKPQPGNDGLSKLPRCLSLKIFRSLRVRDLLSCANVCCTWRDLIQSGALWSQINFSAEREWITNGEVKQILKMYRPFVVHLNLRSCTFLTWPSLRCVSECSNLQELNLSECVNITDAMVQKLTEGCPSLIYLNLSCTNITNQALRELRNCTNLQYLSLAYCNSFTDQGLLYLTAGNSCRSLLHLNVSGCTQMTLNGFRYISAGCPSLTEVVIEDMPTLSDGCVLALLSRCHTLSAISLLEAPHLSDISFKAIEQGAKLKSFSIEGNSLVTEVSWRALCCSSQGLRRLHAAGCTRLNNASLRFIGALRHLQYLDISMCSNVGNMGIKHLTEGLSSAELRELNISHCSRVTDAAVKRIGLRLRKLCHLNLSYCNGLSDKALEYLSDSSIRSLDISGCNIQDQGLAALERVHLKKIALAECVFVTDIGIENLCRNVTFLEDIDISHCGALTDRAARALSFFCRGLTALKMAACSKMTDLAVHYLTTGALYLRELDVSSCILLTDRTLRHLERVCPPLSSVSMSCCRGISRLAALKLRPHVDHWDYSRDDPNPVSETSLVKPESAVEESSPRRRAAST